MLYFTYSVNVILSGLSTRRISFKQDTQCAYNVTLRRVRETIVAVEKQ